ncbi:unnamed protein product [Notodromas monacha]|uniref:Presequence protease, mitochondrial n=1 Tax=Notodromas monacha TaxID=399045 RepID=A0A7R9BTH1_9CRUS|nr:unnamed protein product [Notodromas monacha]CAG0921459.1 unnamed protein product [Notodromas monacha]
MSLIARLRPIVSARVLQGRTASALAFKPSRKRIVDVDATAHNYKVGQKISGFQIQRVEPVPELSLVAIKLNHLKTGAAHLHIARNDRNNVFSINFRTVPVDSTGVPHILEHMTLCGSKEFPVRDPFFKMLTRSLATFMNAMTGSDVTLYPFSSQNEADFRNIMRIYLDAVFYPRLKESDFMQEGWRIEPNDPKNVNAGWEFKGVVFNEMKGVFTDPQSLFAHRIQNELFPNHVYGNISGGAPLSIPRLTWQELKQFHSSHYHPSNARIYTYGDIPLESHLEFIDTHLSKFDFIDSKTDVPLSPTWNQPRKVTVSAQPDPICADAERQSSVAVAYLLDSIQDPSNSLCLQLVSELLISGPNSPFYKALLEPKLGTSMSSVSGYDGSTLQSSFTVGLQGVRENEIEKVLTVIDETFRSATFPKERIEALLHSIELGIKHQSANFGLGLLMGITYPWNHVEDPIDHFMISKHISKFRENLKKDPNFLDHLVDKYFIENKHKLTAILKPDPNFEQEAQKAEAVLLQNTLQTLDEDQKLEWAKKCQDLAEEQHCKEDVSCLPILKLSEIDREPPKYDVVHADIDGVDFQFCAQPTNGVTYFNAKIDTSLLPENLKPYLPTFCSVLAKMGAADLDYKHLDQMIELRTGGLAAGNYVEMKLTNKINGLPGSGHRYAMRSAGRNLNAAAAMNEKFSGYEQILLLKDFSSEDKFRSTLENIREIAALVLNKKRMRCALNDTIENIDDALKSAEIFVSAINGKPLKPEKRFTQRSFIPVTKRTHLVFPFPVNHSSLCFPCPAYVSEHFAALRVAAKLLTSKFLHREVRERGGAYGSGVSILSSGVFSMYSYRDPNGAETFDVFEKAVDWAIAPANFAADEIHEAKLAVFQAEDAPVSPGSRGLTEFHSGISYDMQKKHREQVLAVTEADIRVALEKYVKNANVSGRCLIGPETDKSASLTEGWIKTSDEFAFVPWCDMDFVDSLLLQEAMAAASLEGPECVPPVSFFEETEEKFWICGRAFDGKTDEDRERIRGALRSFLWQTYRKGFPAIGDESGPTSDRGWGCMLRCGQMVLAESLLRLQLGAGWMWTRASRDDSYLSVLSTFADEPSAPFSIHQFALTGAQDGGKSVGEWYGPNTVAHVVKKLVSKLPNCGLRVHVAMDNMLIKTDVNNGEESWKPLLLFVPLRLGLSEVNAIYKPGLKACFKFSADMCLGIIGGTPNHALYFVGCVGDELVYLDPHTTQQTANPKMKEADDEKQADLSYHCNFARRMPMLQIDPSIAVCFLCQTAEDFEALCKWSKQCFVDVEKQPIFEVMENKPVYSSLLADQIEFEYDTARFASDEGLDSSDEFEIVG